MKIAHPLLLFCALLGLLALVGCGGTGQGSSPTLTSTPTTKGLGNITFTIHWPNLARSVSLAASRSVSPSASHGVSRFIPKQAAVSTSPTDSRLIPVVSQSILVIVTAGATELARQTVVRPPAGTNNTTVTFNSIHSGAVTITATAYPNADGTGTAQATGAVTATVINQQTITTPDLVMNTTIAALNVNSSAANLSTGQFVTLTVTALDAATPPNVVLIDPAHLTYTSADAGAITFVPSTVAPRALATAVTAGTHKVIVTETESGISGSVTLTVTLATPITNIVVADVANNRIVGLDKVPATVFTPYDGTQNGGTAFSGNPGDVAIDSKGRIYIADYPYKIIRIDDITGKGRVEYDPTADPVKSGPSVAASAVYVDSQGRIYWRDDSFAINRMDDMTGKNHVYFTNSNFGAPAAIATDSQGRIYVADGSRSRIYRFDDMTGSNPHFFGGDGISAHLALAFTGKILDIDAAGELYIADNGNKRLVRIDPSALDDATKANLVAFPMPNDSTGVPLSIATVAVTHGTTPTIYFTAAGKGAGDEYVVHMDDLLGTNFVKYGTTGSGTGQFAAPVGLAVK